MDPRRQRWIEDILDTPVPASVGGPGSLRQALDEDDTLLRDVETLLTVANDATPAPQLPPGEPTSATPVTPEVGGRVGPYRLEQLLGRGGMGVVYLAVREDDFAQRVALKLVGPGRHNAEILDRFYRERQILADLQHPNIARLLDGGTTADALPYFAMEYVEGEPIDRYCQSHGLSIRERLRLFRKVCAAVHFAHRSLVVHRDLKPGNILVTADGEPKLLDFGIAKILQPDRAPQAGWNLATNPDHRPMTPAYASPEQLIGGAVTTVSDVYGLGVLLYELTSGRPPYRLTGRSYPEIIEQICSREPKPPSAAGTAARARRVDRRLAGDVDAIVLKAMRKEPEHRYGSAAQLADDIERHLEGLPVEAHDGHWRYHATKFARRHKLGLAVLLLLLAFGVLSAVLWRQAVAERARAEAEARQAVVQRTQAEREKRRAERVSSFLEDLFESADPNAAQGAALPVREVLDRGRQRLAAELGDEPEIHADLAGTLGTVYNRLGLYDDARELKQDALRLRRAASLGDRPALAIDLNNLARFHYDLGNYAEAEPLSREALAMFQRLDDQASAATTMLNLAAILTHRGAGDEALALHRDVLEIRRGLYGADHPAFAASAYSLAVLYYTRGAWADAEDHLRRALAIYIAAHGREHTRVASVHNNLGLVLHAQGRHSEARDAFERALTLRRQLLGEEHLHVALVQKNLAALLLDQGETAAAGTLIEPALAALQQQNPGHWTLADAESIWGAYLATRGRQQEAEAYLLRGHRALGKLRGEEDTFTRHARQRLERFYEDSSAPGLG